MDSGLSRVQTQVLLNNTLDTEPLDPKQKGWSKCTYSTIGQRPQQILAVFLSDSLLHCDKCIHGGGHGGGHGAHLSRYSHYPPYRLAFYHTHCMSHTNTLTSGLQPSTFSALAMIGFLLWGSSWGEGFSSICAPPPGTYRQTKAGCRNTPLRNMSIQNAGYGPFS